MGLISAAIGAAAGVAADQWKEYFYCEAIPNNIIMVKATKKNRKGNYGSDNIISDGSKIVVADGQCMLIVEQGKVVDLCAEPGEYIYDCKAEPSLFTGKLSESIPAVFKNIGKRFTFGGTAAMDQRVYYFNTKELIGNKYGTPAPVPFRVVDQRAGIDMDIAIKCFGEYSYKVTNPILFYTNVCGNAASGYTRDQIDGQLKSELLTALQPAFARISDQGIRYSSLPGHTLEIAQALNEVLSASWGEKRGIEVVSFGVSSVKANEEDEKLIKQMQADAAYTNPNLAAAALVGAKKDAMRDAAKNAGGAAIGFMGMNMAGQQSDAEIQSLYAMGAQQPAAPAPAPAAAPAGSWKCTCGAVASGNFCPECGAKKPVAGDAGWTCSCGNVNKGKFCSNCGAPKPAGMPTYKCDKCGWEPEDPKNPPKFCPECGDPFNEADIVS